MNKRRVWRWRLSLGLPLLALALLIAVFRWDWLIPIVTARASAALGRPVHIEHLHVALGRTTAITVEGLRVGNPEGFPDNPPFAAVPRASLTFEIIPLLRRGSFVIPDIILEQPALEVLSREDGTTNYAFNFGGLEGEGGASEAGPRLGVLRIRSGRVHVASARLRADFTIAVATEEPVGQPPQIIAQAEGTYAAQPITARLLGGAILNLRDAEQPWPIDLQLANGPIRVSLRGSMQDPLALRGADLRLELAGPDMARLMPLTGIPIPATPPFRFTGKLAYAAGAVRFTDVVGQVGSTDVAGAFSITTGGERPVVTADLASRRVDLADLGGFIGSTPGRVRTPGQTAVQRQAVARAEASPRLLPTTPINLPRLRAADVRLRYRAGHIEGRGMPFDSLEVALDIDDGTIRLHPVQFGVGQGRVSGDFVLVPRDDGTVHAQGELDLRQVDISRLTGAAGVAGAGTLGGVGRIDATGRSLSELLGRGDGALTVVTVGGELSALLVDLSGLQFGNALLSVLGIPARTKIECLIGDFALRRGILTSRTLLLDTESYVVSGGGSIDLSRETLDWRIRTASKRVSIGSLPTSIAITGSFKDPSIQPDLAELAVRGGAAVGLGILLLPLALLPTIQLGVGENNQCEALTENARRRGR